MVVKLNFCYITPLRVTIEKSLTSRRFHMKNAYGRDILVDIDTASSGGSFTLLKWSEEMPKAMN